MNRFTLLAAAAFLLAACDDDISGGLETFPIQLRITTADGSELPDFDTATVSFRNISSGTTSTFSYPLSEDVRILSGIYDVTLDATAGEMEYHAVSRSVEITSAGMLIPLQAFFSIASDDLIISEVFFTGTLQSSGNQYYGDDYIKLYNNTDHVVYADGLTLFETKFLTTQKLDYTPDIMSEAVTVHALYTIPGSGKEHPVQPGEYVLLADTGIDHRQVNPNSFDLSHADWEWYDESTSPSNVDIDSPMVGNLDKWYCYTLSFFVLHNRGFRAIGIARIPVGKEEYLRDYHYDYNYELVTSAGTFPMTQSAYRLPNEWVVDIVNCSVAAEWQWNVCAPELDRGWTHCGTIDHDKTRYFHAARRKLLYIAPDGRPVFKDTNNSTEDFNPMVTPSEIELQKTPTWIDSPAPATVTYDGITPVKQ